MERIRQHRVSLQYPHNVHRTLESQSFFVLTSSIHIMFVIVTVSQSVVPMQARDPIPAFREFALAEGLMSDADVKDIEKQIVAEVEEAVKFADESPKPVSTSHQTPPVDCCLSVRGHRSSRGGEVEGRVA